MPLPMSLVFCLQSLRTFNSSLNLFVQTIWTPHVQRQNKHATGHKTVGVLQ